MIANTLAFFLSLTAMVLLYYYYKSIITGEKRNNVCKFKFSSVKRERRDEKELAFFSLKTKEKNTFFIDFPILFKFYSNYRRFKAKVKISYKSSRASEREVIVNKTIFFDTSTVEQKVYINDIIIGEIFFEVEMLVHFGRPIMELEILRNSLCELHKEYKLAIKFY